MIKLIMKKTVGQRSWKTISLSPSPLKIQHHHHQKNQHHHNNSLFGSLPLDLGCLDHHTKTKTPSLVMLLLRQSFFVNYISPLSAIQSPTLVTRPQEVRCSKQSSGSSSTTEISSKHNRGDPIVERSSSSLSFLLFSILTPAILSHLSLILPP